MKLHCSKDFGIIVLNKRRTQVRSKNYRVDVDYIRAVKMLDTKIQSPMDLVKFWAFSGPCHEDCPEIEKIKKDRG
jgi:hypothetical protein